MTQKTDLQRDILLAINKNPRASNDEIARIVGCSESYVSQTRKEYSDYDYINADIDQLKKNLKDTLGGTLF